MWLRWFIPSWLDVFVSAWRRDARQYDVVGGTDGQGMSEFAKAQALKQLTELKGWSLLKGFLIEAMLKWNLIQGENRKNVEYTAGIARGLSMAIQVLLNVESYDLAQYERSEREAREARQETDREETRK